MNRHTVAATDVLRVQRHRVCDPVAVDSQRRAVDVLQCVRWFVVVRVERYVGLATPQPRLLGALVLLGTGEQATGWDTGLREAVVVRAAVEGGVLGSLPGDGEIGDQRPLDSGRPLGHPRCALVGGRWAGL